MSQTIIQRIRAGAFATLFSEGVEREPEATPQPLPQTRARAGLRARPASLLDALFGEPEPAPARAAAPHTRASSAT